MQTTVVVLAVALSSCWRSSAPDEPPPVERPAPADARRHTARIADAAEPDADVAGTAAPQVATRADAGVSGVPPGCVRARVISIKVVGQGGVELVVTAGARRGVLSSWTAVLADPAQTPAQIAHIEPAITRLVVAGLNVDTLAAHPFALLCP